MIHLFVLAIITFVMMVISHFIVSKFTGSQFFVLKAYILFLLSICISFFINADLNIFYFLIYCVFLVLFWNSYLIFFINLQNSISFRILREIDESKSKKMTNDEIFSIYPDETSLKDRLDSMHKNNFIKIENDFVKSTPKGKIFASFVIVIRKLFGIEIYG